MRVPAAREAQGGPRWLLVVGAPPAATTNRVRLRDAVRAARMAAPETEPDEYGIDGRGTALEER